MSLSSLSLRPRFLSLLHRLSCTFTAFIPFFFSFLFPPPLASATVLFPRRLHPLSRPSSSLSPSLPVFDGVIFRDNKARWVRAPSILYGDRHKWYFQRCPKFRVESRFAPWERKKKKKRINYLIGGNLCSFLIKTWSVVTPPPLSQYICYCCRKRNQLSYLGNPPGLMWKQFIFRLTAQWVLNYAVHFFLCVYFMSLFT